MLAARPPAGPGARRSFLVRHPEHPMDATMPRTTTNDIAGHRVVRTLGLVRGITVRSRSVLGNIGAGFQSLFGGNITIYTELAERAREEAFELMVQHAVAAGANAVIGMRYDAN